MSRRDYPYITKEITFGNIYDKNDGEIKYTICQNFDAIEMSHDQLTHLCASIENILKDVKKGGANDC